LILEAIEAAGFKPGSEIALAMDVLQLNSTRTVSTTLKVP